jgi:DNA-binding NtrC family response regulator
MVELAGLRILVVEDELFVAMALEEILQLAGCVVIGPILRVANAVLVARDAEIDVALLDVNLAGEFVFPVAEALMERRIPFVLMTGYARSGVPPEYADRPALAKPFRSDAVLGALAAAAKH